MSKQHRLLAALEQDLQQDLSDYRQLQGVTERLHDALLRRDSAAVEAGNQQVVGLVGRSAVRAERRSRILMAFSLPSDGQGMLRLLQLCEADQRQRLAADWMELQRLVRSCHKQNESNGKLLAMQNDILTHLLAQSSASDIYTPQYY